MDWDEVRAGRLARTHLAERAPGERLVEVVRDLCGVHAQVMGSAELQLAARVDDCTRRMPLIHASSPPSARTSGATFAIAR